jgi:hypothetical protein
VNSSQTHIPEASSVIIDNETRPTAPPAKKINPPKNKGPTTLNGGNQPRQNPPKKKQSPPKNKQPIDKTKENQSANESQSLEPIKSLDIVPESNDSIVKETPQLQRPADKSISTDTVILTFPYTSTTDISIPQISLSDPLANGNINKEIKHDNNERLDFI